MRVITLNANGIESAADKGFIRWMQRQRADIVCVQQTGAREHELARTITQPRGFMGFFHDAKSKPGQAGVALYCRHEPDRIVRGFGWEAMGVEGRMIRADFGKLSVLSFHMPPGTHHANRQKHKFALMERMIPFLRELVEDGRDYIICGDWNIAHKEIDCHNWRSSQNASGFLVEERAWLDTVMNDIGFVDAFREVNEEPDQYTWWSPRGQAWNNNSGRRFDYQLVSPTLKGKVVETAIYKKRRFSEHAPLTIDYAYAI